MARSWPPDGRPSSAPSAGDSEAHFGTPRWESGPQVGSQQIEALLEDSMTEPIKDVNKST
ncbi:hypothetical protein K458DRAFT_309388 [Lentithecium fluviatile CBS 122367]|nr:hypothetical protein K458DRAFT_309388 [Lentithecium fluviatile CBS 122367]